MRYDGTKDPQEHLTAFEARMNLEGVGDAVRCRAFNVTLAGPTIQWFNALPQESITAFVDISRSFFAQFTTRIAKAKHPINLLGIIQKVRESTRKFLDKFNDECLKIDCLTDSIASQYLTNGLLNKDFRKHLTTKLVWTIQKIQNVAREYINDEEIVDKGILPRQLKDRTGRNKSLYCGYHKGKLAEFFQFKREPRKRECERSKEDRSRIVKLRQISNENPDNGLMVVVNVIEGRDAPPRLKLAARKDAKVLTMSTGNPKSPSKKPPKISFGTGDRWCHDHPENQPMVITAMIGTGLVKQILVDTGAISNIMFRNVFDALGLKEADLKTHQHGVIGWVTTT
ncbi:uncharacterized protein [Arachis hypogaea]|uniref:uncharacterized protein n=1 Tax=Arachis hypogaea TaxID=3818 RepID=UPI003B213B9B